MDILLLTIRLFLFGIFALAGIGKLLDPEGSRKAVREFGVPDGISKPVAILLPITEIAVAILLLPVQVSWFGAIGGGALMLIFIGGMLWQMWQGNAPDCHCFGQIHSEPVSIKSLLRNAAFVVLALFLIFQGRENQGYDLFNPANEFSETNAMQIIIGIAVLGFLTAIVYFLNKISGQQVQIMRRIEVLELISHDGGKEVEREDVKDPAFGLPIGASVPAFEIADIYGKKTGFETILPAGKPSLMFFVSPSCNPCEALKPEIVEWQKELNDKVNFVFVSSGKSKDNEKKFPESEFGRIYLQKENEIADLLRAEWTPTALFIASDRSIASRPAAGDSAIRELIEKIKDRDLSAEPVYITNGEQSKIGESAPDFSLEDLEGNQISREIFDHHKTLVTYWSMTCPYCVNMMEDLQHWDKTKGADEPKLFVISSGDADPHHEMALKSTVVLDDKHELGPGFGLSGTPSAVFVGNDGKIVSETAVGAEQIWALLGKKKKNETD
ncbi:MAG: thioredoxin fold domain-containing protein [Pyrinomonadaceae bacterium]